MFKVVATLILSRTIYFSDPYQATSDSDDPSFVPSETDSDDSGLLHGYSEYSPPPAGTSDHGYGYSEDSPPPTENSRCYAETSAQDYPNPNYETTEPESDDEEILTRMEYEVVKANEAHTSFTTNAKKVFEFSGPSGVNDAVVALLQDGSPFDFFEFFISDDILEMIVDQTNLYATQILTEATDISGGSRLNAWVPTTKNEIRKLLGILGYMGLVNMPTIQKYWSTDKKYSNSICRDTMPRNRFELLLSMFHFSDNQENVTQSRIHKVKPLLDAFLKNCQLAYTPEKIYCIDESLIPFRGRLVIKQYLPQKAHRYGVKVFKLCTDKGYTWNMKIYEGKEADKGQSVPTKVVMELSDNLLDAGRTAVTDNYYTSLDLAKKLLNRKTHLLGTLRRNRKGNPPEIVNKKLKKGEVCFKELEEGVTVLKWRDQRDVLMLSTIHSGETVKVIKKGKEIEKPKMVVDYNEGKASIDLSDQFSSYGSCLRKTVKWYRKVAIEIILGTAVVNARFLYKKVTGNDTSLLKFREHIVDKLLEGNISDENDPSASRNSRLRSHVFSKQPGSSRIGRRYCRGCYQKKLKNEIPKTKVRKVTTFCRDCPGMPRYCLECFNAKHV